MTESPDFLTVEDVESLHDAQLRMFGGLEGVRDMRVEIDEPIELAPYDPHWASLYAADAAELASAVRDRLRAAEHFGSTAVAGLCAKPIIDILVAFVEWPLRSLDREALVSLGYEYLGEAGVAGREYFRRRAGHATNLAVVEWRGALWNDNVALRDYLRAHPNVARDYGEEKHRAWTEGARTLLRYSTAKSGYVAELAERAQRWQSGLPSVEESEIAVVPHDLDWARLYVEEAGRIESTIGGRCAAVEHIGSTAVPGLLAKPIIDILVATVDGAAPSADELRTLAGQSYVFLGEDWRRPERWFWRKRGLVSFNLSLVPWQGDLWRHNLLVRDYLRGHPLEVSQYAEIKRQAFAASPNSLLGYQNYKREFMTGLRARALEWGCRV